MSNECSLNSSQTKNDGRGTELKYEIYFPPNTCMPQNTGIGKCRELPYPLQNAPQCSSIYSTCMNTAQPSTSIYGTDPRPSELYGGALAMNEGDGMFYYHNPYGFDLSLTYNRNQPYHWQ